MPLIKYQDQNFRAASLEIIRQANEIIEAYTAQGYELTLRQLYYQFVSRDILPNNQKSYKRLGGIVNDARMAGLIDWDHITDRTRNLRNLPTWDSPQDIVDSCSKQFRYDMWENQRYYCEVWVEKDALVGVLERICNELRVPYFSCRGYVSQSEMWAAGRRLLEKRREGKKIKVFHLGDHDPSGIDMTRDITDRLTTFAETDISVDRLALNMPQVRQYGPPPNPAKDTDSRAEWYNREYGDESWELDALEPSVISDLIRAAVMGIRQEEPWAADIRRERLARAHLAAVSGQWDEITPTLDLPEESD